MLRTEVIQVAARARQLFFRAPGFLLPYQVHKVPPKDKSFLAHGQSRFVCFQQSGLSTTSDATSSTGLESVHEYHRVADATLEDLYESFADLGELVDGDYDAELSQGVLTVKAGKTGTYVINTQTPNRQIWMSSPISGPWRYDWDAEKNSWISTRDSHSLRDRLKEEFSNICQQSVDISAEEPGL